MFKAKKELWMIVLALATLIVCFAPATMAGERVGVTVSEPFEVNGEVYPAGALSIREVGTFSPVATINEVVVDGRSLGVLIAHEGEGAATASRDELIFTRANDGHLVLVGVALTLPRGRSSGSRHV
jgi:hypothetical protein